MFTYVGNLCLHRPQSDLLVFTLHHHHPPTHHATHLYALLIGPFVFFIPFIFLFIGIIRVVAFVLRPLLTCLADIF